MITTITELEKKLRSYAKLHLNVLLEGRHGVGKSSVIAQIFKENNWNYKILTASTLDPYLDLIGVAKEKYDEEHMVDYIENVLPKHIAFDDLDAIFIDELNRSNKVVLNAVLELVQMKSVRDKKMNRLKVVWSAINPYDDTLSEEEQIYNVIPLDPALKDRFHVYLEFPYKLNEPHLMKKYGKVAEPFIDWWNKDLTQEFQYKCSPRRLEYAIDIYDKIKDIEHVLNKDLPFKLLKTRLKEYQGSDRFQNFVNSVNAVSVEDAAKIINIQNIEMFADAINKKFIDKKYINSVNIDYLYSYVSNNGFNDKSFIRTLVDFSRENEKFSKIVATVPNFVRIINDSLSESNNIFDKSLSVFIKNNNIVEFGKQFLKDLYNAAKNDSNLDDMKNIYDSFIVHKNYNIFKQYVVTFFEKMIDILKQYVSAKKNNDVVLQKSIQNQYNEHLSIIFNNNYSNKLTQLILGSLLKHILNDAKINIKKEYFSVINYEYLKKIQSFVYVSLIEDVDDNISDILQYLLEFKNYKDFERETELNLEIFEDFLTLL